ncbi:hypothetical protein GUJ93_ZPchr0013g35041 [Zizania palustris]|uniref:Uncharacterized protein n=1 Tax=Zizania palustris TaxID=103762 RepID=A0A8J5WST0_ZIZPA|nr:hypothetical protein GUJ93_ZPchr0013g35041 [Zizania palustris]
MLQRVTPAAVLIVNHPVQLGQLNVLLPSRVGFVLGGPNVSSEKRLLPNRTAARRPELTPKPVDLLVDAAKHEVHDAPLRRLGGPVALLLQRSDLERDLRFLHLLRLLDDSSMIIFRGNRRYVRE